MQRIFNYADKIIICTMIIVISGCASMMDKDGCALLAIKGSMDAKLRGDGSRCSLEVNYHNLEKSSIKPDIEVRYFDGAGNTIGSDHYYFDEIYPGRSQQKIRSVQCGVATIEVDDARSCNGGRCYAICGVDRKTYSFK